MESPEGYSMGLVYILMTLGGDQEAQEAQPLILLILFGPGGSRCSAPLALDPLEPLLGVFGLGVFAATKI